MANYTAGRIKKAHYFKVKKLRQKDSNWFIIGFDSEADTSSQGNPMMYQFSLPATAEQDVILKIVPEKKHAGLTVFLDFLDEYCAKRGDYLIYVWNLSYELTQLFHDLPKHIRVLDHFIIEHVSKVDGKQYEWEIELVNIKRQILTFRKTYENGQIQTLVRVLDGKAFYNTSLDKAAKMLGLGEKFVLGEKLSRSRFTRGDLENEEFLTYARRDAYITRLIGEYIANQHDVFGLPITISAPHFAATLFKTQFLTTDRMSCTEPREQAGLYSYHGGKNGFYLDGPTEFPSIWFYDITSAYPEAMRALPDYEKSGWIPVNSYKPGVHALYCVTMEYDACTYRGMQLHDGTWASSGLITETWITSYELDAMMANGEVKNLLACHGYQMVGPSGGPLTDYVDKFFSVKKSTSGPERETAKLLLNSLYGKFFQKQPVGSVGVYNFDEQRWVESNVGENWDYEAGGLYDPPVASLITGYVRGKIHRLEHKYQSVMTSTDGLFGSEPPDYRDLGSGLGLLKAVSGRLRIWRERLYVFDGDDGERKFALHGFHGTLQELEEIPLARGEYSYLGQQMITLKMSAQLRGANDNRQMYAPGTFTMLPFVIRI